MSKNVKDVVCPIHLVLSLSFYQIYQSTNSLVAILLLPPSFVYLAPPPPNFLIFF